MEKKSLFCKALLCSSLLFTMSFSLHAVGLKGQTIQICDDGAREWFERDRLELYVIACLSKGEEPRRALRDGPVLERHRMLRDAVETGQLKCEELRPEKSATGRPNKFTVVSRKVLRKFAAKEGHKELLKLCDEWDRWRGVEDRANTSETGQERYQRWAKQQDELIRNGEATSLRDAAEQIARIVGVSPEHVEREARRARAENKARE